MTTYRPTTFAELVGQDQIRARVLRAIGGAVARKTAVPPMLFLGNPGLGKTTFARCVASAVHGRFVPVSGPAIQTATQLVRILAGLRGGDCLFIDEVHNLGQDCQDLLLLALEDNTLSVLQCGVPKVLKLPTVLFMASTTNPAALTEPMRSRMLCLTMDRYSEEELATIAGQAWQRGGFRASVEATCTVAQASKGTPRTALLLAERVADLAALERTQEIRSELARRALEDFGVSPTGLTGEDLSVLRALHTLNRPCGVAALAQMADVPERTYLTTLEPALVRLGLVIRGGRGRELTEEGRQVVLAA
jgi:Holliday junction DNA helicase RuvB